MTLAHTALRSGRHSSSGQAYLVTFTTAQRQPHFATWDTAADAARLLTTSRCWESAQLLAWVLMPDHWHGLVALGEGGDLSSCIGRLKAGTARRLRQQHPALGRIWSSAFHDHALRKDEDLQTAARYIALNPVRAGLVKRVGDYPYWDVAWL